MKFTEMLRARWRNADTLLCVGLDPDLARLPEELAGKPDAIYSFCTGIVDATADLVWGLKAQTRSAVASTMQQQTLSVPLSPRLPTSHPKARKTR